MAQIVRGITLGLISLLIISTIAFWRMPVSAPFFLDATE